MPHKKNMEKIEQKIKGKLPKNAVMLYYDYLRSNSYTYRTSSQYVKYIQRLMSFEPPKTILTSYKIKKFLSVKTTTLYQASIKKFLQFLQEEYDFEIDSFQYPRIVIKDKLTLPLTRDEINRLIEHMPNDKLFFQFKTLTEFLAKTGTRITEALSLKVKDINFEDWNKDRTKGTQILLTKTKGGRQRLIPISPELMKNISLHCEDENNEGFVKDDNCYVFDFRYTQTIKRFKRMQRKAEKDPNFTFYREDTWDQKYLEKSSSYYRKILDITSMKVLKKHCYCHLLRHSYATHLDSLNVQVSIISKLLGHKSLNTTGKYLHPSEQQLEVGAI